MATVPDLDDDLWPRILQNIVSVQALYHCTLVCKQWHCAVQDFAAAQLSDANPQLLHSLKPDASDASALWLVHVTRKIVPLFGHKYRCLARHSYEDLHFDSDTAKPSLESHSTTRKAVESFSVVCNGTRVAIATNVSERGCFHHRRYQLLFEPLDAEGVHIAQHYQDESPEPKPYPGKLQFWIQTAKSDDDSYQMQEHVKSWWHKADDKYDALMD
eukprot:TRINITY_DN14499_c0_g1_i1.p1 TRINITY_DN14499_c0_g1~~TRINITY_DN14499_c0_g1_i1.p1  ORF type:complete len:222 (+),score=36.47 TRINITY_DN14499_c0_g1_i1:24-668(+)